MSYSRMSIGTQTVSAIVVVLLVAFSGQLLFLSMVGTPSEQLWRLVGFDAVAMVVLTLFGGWVNIRRAARLTEIANIMRRTSEGDLTAQIPVGHGITLATTANQIDHMAILANQISQNMSGVLRQVNGLVEQLAGASHQLADGADHVLTASTVQSDAAANLAASIEQLSVSISVIADNAAESSKVAGSACEHAQQGDKAVSDAREQILFIKDKAAQSSVAIDHLANRSQQVTGILAVIREIADQTNLLALNAAIEAARAGEQGRGFAVVADEVRKLAEKSRVATAEIAGVLDGMKEEAAIAIHGMQEVNRQVESGSELAATAGGFVQAIISEANSTSNLIGVISSATREQSAGSQHIAQTVERIAEMAQNNTVEMKNNQMAVESLRQMATALRDGMRRFRLA
ncbi:methyl-accepting chemotaxis protein [Parachitinimonas caeni]|uniref:Methyl-accepting chemotaxis protein n=1 Tax=Parachitinimonas caeni TaxID=3031301 RepID=A0ABT7DVR3_9NEIS|nr:methyl-accepting chemotaxis protein [Parachitinimonas caeni]MDK2123203.1 methyl-accepting chemotaxis protein [Parachitinimonas caeni]